MALLEYMLLINSDLQQTLKEFTCLMSFPDAVLANLSSDVVVHVKYDLGTPRGGLSGTKTLNKK